MNSEKPINILLAVSNNVIREGLRKILLGNRMPTNVVNQETVLGSFSPDLILFDLNQPIQTLRSLYPQAKPVLLDTGIDERDIN